MNDQTLAGANGLSPSGAPLTNQWRITVVALAILGGGVIVTLILLARRGSPEPLSGPALFLLLAGLFFILYASYLASAACHRKSTSCRPIDAVQVAVVSMVVVAAYAHAIGVGFLADDFNFLGPSSWQQLATSFFPVGQHSFYRPLEQVLWAADYSLYATNPAGYHVTNGLLLALSAALVYILAVLMLRNRFAAMIAALLYGLHPLHVQATVWIAGRPSLLVTVFFVLAVIGYVLGRQRSRVRWLAWLAAGLALMSKESAVTLPAIIALTYVVRVPLPARVRPTESRDVMTEAAPAVLDSQPSWPSWIVGLLGDVAPYVGLVIAYLMFRVVVIGELRPFYQGSYTDWPVVTNNLATAIKMLGIPWMQPEPATPFVTSHALGWVLTFVGLTVVSLLWTRARLVFWGMAWFLVTYGPLVNVQYVQERFFDLPLVGVAMAAAAVLLLLGEVVAVQNRRVWTAATVVGVLVVGSIAALYVQSIRARTAIYYDAAEMVTGPAEKIKGWYPNLPPHAHITVFGVPTRIGSYFNLAYSWGLGRQLQDLYPPGGPRIDVYSDRNVAWLAASRPLGSEDYFFLFRPGGQLIDLSPVIAPHRIRFVELQDAQDQPSYQQLSPGETLTVSLLLDPAVTDALWLRYRVRGGARIGLQAHNLRGQCRAEWSNEGETWAEQRLALPAIIEQGWQVTLTLSNLGPAGVVDISDVGLQAQGTEVLQSTCVSP